VNPLDEGIDQYFRPRDLLLHFWLNRRCVREDLAMDIELFLVRSTSCLFLVIGLPAPIGLIAHAVTALRFSVAPMDRSTNGVNIHQRVAIGPEVTHEER